MKSPARLGGIEAAVIILAMAWAGSALAHCDTMDGPVVILAQKALEKGDVTFVLPWVAKEKEGEIREVFDLAIAVRGKGAKEKELGDRAREPGTPNPLLPLIEEKTHEGIHKYYVEGVERKKHAGESVEAGRAY